MPRYKITQHLTGWKLIGNFIDAKDEDEAWEKYNENGENVLVNKEWKEVDEEYKLVDTEITKHGDTPTEEVKKWRESKVIKGNDYEINPDGSEVE